MYISSKMYNKKIYKYYIKQVIRRNTSFKSTMKKTVYFILGLSIAMFQSCITENDETFTVEEYVKPGNTLPDFHVIMNDGTSLSTSDLKGKVSVLMFFTTECSDCRKTLPVVQNVYNVCFKDSTIRFVCISREQSALSLQTYWDEHNLNLPYSAQEDRIIYEMFATSGVPRIYISDSALIVRTIFTDSQPITEEDLYQAIELSKR